MHGLVFVGICSVPEKIGWKPGNGGHATENKPIEKTPSLDVAASYC
jgi:hypothetical protein